MSESLGARLRRHREERHVELTTIAEQTKIKLSLFSELERDDVSRWPSGIFRRAYIRAYAHAIGLDPDVVLRQFLEAHPDPGEVVDAAFAAATATDRTDGPPPTRLRSIVGAAIESFSRRQRPSTESPIGAAHVTAKPAVPSPQSAEVRGTCGTTDAPLVQEPSPAPADFLALAQLCTKLGRVASGDQLNPLLQEAAGILNARGLVLWLWDGVELRPAAAHGYSDRVLAQLPGLRPDADNATAAAFRLGQPCAASGSHRTNSALVVPLLTAGGCSGVLALELPPGGERGESARAFATILAALLAQLLGGEAPAQMEPRADPIAVNAAS